jgi:hypothetical protein
MTHAFKSIDWGQDFAKGDVKLKDYFVHFPEFEEVLSGAKRYVVGRKGAGKTAVIEKLRLEQESDAMKFNADITLRNFPLNDLMDLGDKSYTDKSKYVSAWLFIIYVELAKIISRDHGAGPAHTIDELRDFLATNQLDNDLGFIATVERLKDSRAKVSVLANWAGGEAESGRSQTIKLNVHYQKVVSALARLIGSVASESEYWIFVDELDEGYKAGATNIRLVLLALIRSIEDSVLSLRRSGLNFRPLLVLRSDIFDTLEDNDLNKLDDFVVRLRWISHEGTSQHSLLRIAEGRITAQYPDISERSWEAVVDNLDPKVPREVKSIWQYITSRTFDRPRDIVKFLKYCQRNTTGTGKLKFVEVKQAEALYSNWLRNEIRDEIHSYLPIWQECLQAISRIGTGKFSAARLKTEFEADHAIISWENSKYTIDQIIDLLFDFGIIGYFDGNRWIFKHKDDDLTRNKSADLIVHYGLYQKLRLRFGARSD